jgi:hypothetical protein
MNEPDTPPTPASKEAIAKALGCDRRTVTRIIEEAEIPPAGHSPAGLRLYDLEAVQEALEDKEATKAAAKLPEMKPEQAAASLVAMLEFNALMLDALAPVLPAETIRAAYEQALEMRTAGKEPEFLWALKAG